MAELVPSARIFAMPAVELPKADSAPLLEETFESNTGPIGIRQFLESSSTDALVVMKRGAFAADWHAPHSDPAAPHIVFSISKSLTALLAGMAQDDGLLDPAAPVTDYVPEMRGSAYADASVQQVLDMRVGVDIDETYLDPLSEYGRYRRAMLWNPALAGEEPETMVDFLRSLRKGSEHGGPFRYRSPNSDLLGIIVERATGRRYADLLSKRVWPGIGARSDAMVTVDWIGNPRGAGGISMTARDLARVGEMMRLRGVVDGRRVVSARWVEDTLSNGDRAAWAAGDFPFIAPAGSYRNKWYATNNANGAFFAVGIHGQWLYVDPTTETVIVRFASQPVPVDDPLDQNCLRLFERLSAL